MIAPARLPAEKSLLKLLPSVPRRLSLKSQVAHLLDRRAFDHLSIAAAAKRLGAVTVDESMPVNSQ